MLARRTPPDLPKMTVEEFFDWHERQEEKYELIDGRPVLKFPPDPLTGMASGTVAHGAIIMNASAALRAQLRGKRCRPMPSDVAIRMLDGRVRYPDVSVDCGPFDPQARAAAQPVLVLEVLSPSTSWAEHGKKLADYRAVESLRTIVLIDQSQRFAQVWSRNDDGAWRLEEFEEAASVLRFPEIDAELAFEELYEGAEPFAPPATA